MNIIGIIKILAVLIAAGILGNWFLSELKKSKIRQDPWYKPYISTPGLLILLALLLPLIAWLVR
ncbi:MAG: hypothetical protein KGY38_02955 [Desulfobacterales bacterium]|nr:hypothetical protein [Desulfobacterales bacterium]